MAAKLNVAELDFDAIKANLKDYLKAQAEFTDFDFEGAGINILLDILAYNTHYNSFYLNMVANEMFLDSASLRQSVVSHAKLLGYTPRSNTASQAIVDVTITKQVSDPTTTLTLPRFTEFTSQSSDGIAYTFLATEEYVAANVGQVFTFSDVKLKEGSPVTYIFEVSDLTNPKQIFELPDESIDTSTLQVIVQKSPTELTQNNFTLATDSTEVTTTSEVYYLEEGQNGKYRIYFGDDIFGKKLSNGNLVAVSYINTKGSDANGLNTFKMLSSLLGGSTTSTTTVTNSSGGSVRELVEDIKFAAPKSFISNNRAVTKNDYITLINKKYPYFDSVNVWGGEEEEPPVYGKVFIAAKPRLGFEVTDSEKEYLKNDIIRPFSILTVTPEFVDVNYNYLIINTDVSYDPRLTSRTSGELQTAIRNAIKAFATDTLNTFTSSFKLSKLLRYIDDVDTAITSSTASVMIQKRFNPSLTSSGNYTLKFDTELSRGSSAKDRIFSNPAYVQADFTSVNRNVFLEETPDSFSGIESVEVITPGANYKKTPTVVVDGDGTGAELEAVIVNSKLKSVKVIKQGSGYTSALLTIVPAENDTGTSATARAVIQGRTGKVRSYYFDDTGAKKILDANAGELDYINGTITLNSFAPTDVNDDLKTLKVHAKPNALDFKSARSTILVLDAFDPSAIVVNIKAVTS